MSILTFGETPFGEAPPPFGENLDEDSSTQSVAAVGFMSASDIPAIAKDFTLYIESGIAQMSFEISGSIMNNIYLSLMVRKESFFPNRDFGSRLHTLLRKGNTERTAATAVEYCKEALQWIIDIGRVIKFDISTQIEKLQDLHRLKLSIKAYETNGRVVTFETFMEVV